MTALVAILNKQSVALAADSAVTTGDAKIFNTVNKLFALSKHQPVGIMVYSSAEVMGVPVETVIKEFRRVSGEQSYEHLEAYAEAFREFLCSDNSLFTDEHRKYCLCTLVCEAAESICSATFNRLSDNSTLRDKRDALGAALADLERSLLASERINVLKQTRQLVAEAINNELNEAVGWIKSILPVNIRKERLIRKLITERFFREFGSGRETGFVISGFGTADVFPRLRAFEFHCSAFGFHKIRPCGSIDITVDMIAQIAPFAQKDVMSTFVEGMDPRYRQNIASFLNTYLEEKRRLFLADTPPKTEQAAAIEALNDDLGRQLMELLQQISYESFISPTMQVVASMPKEELAVLAEALVNLTALKRKASNDAETVGGPTDVAVISKGDGLVWIKRKHYFDPKYNPNFVAKH